MAKKEKAPKPEKKPREKKVRENKSREKAGRSQFILFIGEEGGILVHLQGTKVLKRLYAANAEPASTKMMTELLLSSPGSSIRMLVDVMDQSYIRHDLPPVSAMSVGKLIRRRLERDFSGDDIKGSLMIGRDTGGRKDWRYLLIALSNIRPLTDWLEMALDVPNRFEGIFLLPVEAQKVILSLAGEAKKPKKPKKGALPEKEVSRWKILVSHHKVGGFRQVVLHDRQLIFTRLAQPIGETSPEVIAGSIEQEIVNTTEYIKRLSYTEQAGLDVFIIASQEIKNALETARLKARNVELMTPHEAAVALDIGQAALPGDHFADVVLATFFGQQKKHVLRLDNDETGKISMWQSAARNVKYVCILIAGTLAAYAGYLAFDAVMMQDEVSQLERERTTAQQTLSVAQQAQNSLPPNADEILATLDAYDFFSKDEYSPFDFVSRLIPQLADGIRVKSLSWLTAAVSVKTAQGAPQQATPVAIELQVEFFKHTGSSDDFLEFSNRFLTRLRAEFTDYTVTADQLPGTLADTESLEVTIGGNQQSTTFTGEPLSLRIVMAGPVVDPNAGANTGAPAGGSMPGGMAGGMLPGAGSPPSVVAPGGALPGGMPPGGPPPGAIIPGAAP